MEAISTGHGPRIGCHSTDALSRSQASVWPSPRFCRYAAAGVPGNAPACAYCWRAQGSLAASSVAGLATFAGGGFVTAAIAARTRETLRSEERGVGKERVRRGKTWRQPAQHKKKTKR